MKLLRLTLSVVAISMFLVASSWAQPGNGPRFQERMKAEIDETVSSLELTGVKADTVRALLAASSEKRMGLMRSRMQGGDTEGRVAMQAKMAELQTALDADLAKVLSEDEMTKWKAISKERAARRRGPRGPRRG